MKLPKDVFMSVVKNTPLISIDFVIERMAPQRTAQEGSVEHYLLGQRRNAPAKGFWFNLGGRILKNEPLAEAMVRIFKEETGQVLSSEMVEFLGVFDHIYEDNVFGQDGFGTHYICLVHKVKVPHDFDVKSYSQHSHYKWVDRAQILEAPDIHGNTKICF